MIEGLKPYSEYKESGLPWLGRYPKNWSVRRTKILFEERVQKGFPNEPLLAATQTKGVVKKEDYETRTVTAQKDLHLLKLVEVGDYVISLRSFQGGIEVAHCRGIISPAYTVLKPRTTATSGYYSHFFKAKPFIDSLSLFVTGIREGQNIDYERLSRAELPMPSEDEQAAIVRFLDHANRKIDGFIRAKRKLIRLLNEQKHTIIHRAVTCGLNPKASLKPSGIPWLGEIPEHWDVLRAKFLFEPVDVRSKTGEEELLTVSSSDGVVLRSSRTIMMFKAASYIGHKLCWPQDLVINSLWAWAKGLGFSDHHGIVSTAYGVYRLRASFKTRWTYFNHLLRSSAYDWEFHVRSRGIWKSRLQLTDTSFLDMSIVIPPELEALNIVRHVDANTAELTAAIVRIEREIVLMQEYRVRLTADIVTGELDVREASAKLPEPDEEIIKDNLVVEDMEDAEDNNE
jgi:type I restriction enzyme S subunit